jgi:arsenite-transporting ATPase
MERNGAEKVLAEKPDLKVSRSVNGNWTANVTKTVVLQALATSTTSERGAVPAIMDDVDVPVMRVAADGDDFVLSLPLPLVSAGEVEMARRDDDLVIEVGGQRRVVTLPSVLRRCIVQNADVGNGVLRVRFERDEEQWASGR